jgi:hypothetical protein
MAFDFPTKPGGTVADLWQAVLKLLPQLSGKITVLRGQSIGTVETRIAHGVGFVPTLAWSVKHANLEIWQPRDPDSIYVYFQASTAATIDIAVLR